MRKSYQSYSWWHKQRDQAICEMYRNKMSVFEIAMETHYDEWTILTILKRWGCYDR